MFLIVNGTIHDRGAKTRIWHCEAANPGVPDDLAPAAQMPRQTLQALNRLGRASAERERATGLYVGERGCLSDDEVRTLTKLGLAEQRGRALQVTNTGAALLGGTQNR